MTEDKITHKRWVGRYILGVSAIHTVFGVIVFQDVLMRIFADGLFNAIGDDPLRGAVTWFLFTGFSLAVIGLAVDLLEKHAPTTKLSVLGWVVFAISGLGVILMPASGFWLLMIPAFTMVLRSRSENFKT